MDKTVTKRSWQNYPIDKPHRIEILLHFTNKQFLKLVKGFIPQQMEDHWFIYFENDWLYFHRSWTGFGIYKAQLKKEPNGNGYLVNEFWVERNQKKYKNKDDDEDIRIFSSLVEWLLRN